MNDSPMDNHEAIRRKLDWPAMSPVDVVLDTDTYNEIDDQFALVHALLSPERINLQAVYAAPFHNQRSQSAGNGMHKSYDEIIRILQMLGRDPSLALRGSDRWMESPGDSAVSDARDDLTERARSRPEGEPLYVVAIGAITNIASALAAAPDIREKIVVLWLGGQPLYWSSAHEFNLAGDKIASRFILNCGVPLVLFPCSLVAEALRTTLAEMERLLDGSGQVGNYLCEIYRTYESCDLTAPGASKVIWDLAPIGWLIRADWARTSIVPSPVLTDDCTWQYDADRHPIRLAEQVHRDGIFADLFSKVRRLGQ